MLANIHNIFYKIVYIFDKLEYFMALRAMVEIDLKHIIGYGGVQYRLCSRI